MVKVEVIMDDKALLTKEYAKSQLVKLSWAFILYSYWKYLDPSELKQIDNRRLDLLC